MANVYYNKRLNSIDIEQGSKTTSIALPDDVTPQDVAYVIQSPVLTEIIKQLTRQ